MSLLLLLSVSGTSPDRVLARAQRALEPVKGALDAYRRKHGHYPPELTELVKDGLLNEVPELPSLRGTSSHSGPYYDASVSFDFYRLAFMYDINSGFGPGHWRGWAFVSDDPKGWRRAHDRMEDLVAERLLAIYRVQHDGKTLRRFMSEVIAKLDCDYLYQSRVTAWLGDGKEIIVPPEVLAAGKAGYVYQAEDDASRRYCFVYKDHWLPMLKGFLPPEERAKYPADNGHDGSVDINYPVLDKLFLIQEVSGRSSWKLLRECPKSPRDKPSHRSLEKAR
jgi:hypothetical protein